MSSGKWAPKPTGTHVERLHAYVAQVAAGAIPACVWVRAACARHTADLARQGTPEFPYAFDAVRAERACRFKALLPHVKGVWSRKHQRFTLSPHQCFITGSLFGWVHKDSGLRRFSEAFIVVPRKNGKTFDAAATGLYMLCADGENAPEVYAGATSEDQAMQVFGAAREMCLASPDLRKQFKLDVRAKSILRPDGGKFEPVIGKPGDGASPSCALVDEFHEHKTPRLYDAMALGMGAREQPLMLIITTAGSNLAGPCFQRQLYAQRVLDGKQVDEALFAVIYTIDTGESWDTLDAAKKANPNYGVSIFPERIERDLKAAIQSAYLQNEYKTKHLDVWCGARAGWANMQQWSVAPKAPKLSKMGKRRCWAGIDLGSTDDPSALCLLFEPGDNGRMTAFFRLYLPEAALRAGSNAADYRAWKDDGHLVVTPGNIADYGFILNDLIKLSGTLNLQEAGFDPWQAAYFASQGVDAGIDMVKVPQNAQQLSEPMKSIGRMLASGTLEHDHSPVMLWMMGNVVAKEGVNETIYPHKESKEAKIDGFLALLNAANRALPALNQAGNIDAWLKAAPQKPPE